MRLFLLGMIICLTGFFAHLALWRTKRPQRPYRTLLGLFTATTLLGTVGLRGMWPSCPMAAQDTIGLLHVTLFCFAVFLSYIVLYSAIEEDSPSASMLKFVAMAESTGRAREEFAPLITDELLTGSRLRALVQSGWLSQVEDRYRLTGQGRFFARLFSIWHRLLKLPKGG